VVSHPRRRRPHRSRCARASSRRPPRARTRWTTTTRPRLPVLRTVLGRCQDQGLRAVPGVLPQRAFPREHVLQRLHQARGRNWARSARSRSFPSSAFPRSAASASRTRPSARSSSTRTAASTRRPCSCCERRATRSCTLTIRTLRPRSTRSKTSQPLARSLTSCSTPRAGVHTRRAGRTSILWQGYGCTVVQGGGNRKDSDGEHVRMVCTYLIVPAFVRLCVLQQHNRPTPPPCDEPDLRVAWTNFAQVRSRP
jgi:hypothetical protein